VSNLLKFMRQLRILYLMSLLSLISNNCSAKISTTDILKAEPFNVIDVNERDNIMMIAKDLDINLDRLLHGEVYSKKPYDDAQQQEIANELIVLFNKNFHGKLPSKNKLYIATAGAPGVGKSVFLEELLAKDSHKSENIIYVDPDRQALRLMYSYWKLANTNGDEVAYETYRDASNFICNFQLVWAIYKGYNIAHGTTSTNERVAKSLLPGLKKLGYTVDIHVLFANMEARTSSLLHRLKVQDFYQVTPADAKGKVAPVYSRLTDAYLKCADSVRLYYNTGNFWLNTSPIESAKSLKLFAVMDKKISDKVTVYASNANVLDLMINDVVTEIDDQNQQTEIIKVFKSWS